MLSSNELNHSLSAVAGFIGHLLLLSQECL